MKEILHLILIVYMVVINIAAFFLYRADKKRAKSGKWRISEKALLLIALFGGSLGAFLAMQIFRHKTKHWYFVIGIPLILALQITACYLFCKMTGIQ